MRLSDVAGTSSLVAATSSRLAKIAALAELIRRAGPEESAIVVSYISGETIQRRTGVGWAALKSLPIAAEHPTLEVVEVDQALEAASRVSGSGSARRRSDILTMLLGKATRQEQEFLRGLLTDEVRQGALRGLAAEAVAKAFDVPAGGVRRAAMLAGSLPPVAEALKESGPEGLSRFHLRVGRAVQPMLAKSAPTVEEVLAQHRPVALEWKLDGVRIQAHRNGGDVEVFTRSLDRITERVPEVVEAVLGLPIEAAILDGEAIVLSGDGRPRPFQETGSRLAAHSTRQRQTGLSTRVTPMFFDVLHLDGQDLIDRPAAERFELADEVLPSNLRIPRQIVDDVDIARTFLAQSLDQGHEGLVAKVLSSPYEAGRRGEAWIKIKVSHTLDLVILAAEWGHGRRRGWLSNLHLGAFAPETGTFVMLGKTFKGLTDEMLTWQTKRLLQLETGRDQWTVYVQPELVVEVAFDGVQTSPRYPGGMALRFARVLRYRTDKRSEEANTVDDVRDIHLGLKSA